MLTKNSNAKVVNGVAKSCGEKPRPTGLRVQTRLKAGLTLNFTK
ncbi:MAG TPA: hypothetical protein VKU02_31935 [Gemmataceae bacterium]|nr:hypothetical protein [Gemmataceae bacterium]